jgi:small-conductance mechanosensitive channel
MLFNQTLYHNPVHQWLLAGAVALVLYLVLRGAKAIIQKRLEKQAQKTETNWDDLFLALTERVHSLSLLLLAVYIGSLILTLPGSIPEFLVKAVFAILLFQVAVIGSRAIGFLMGRYRHQKMASNASAATMLSTLGFVLQLLLWLILVLLALDNFGINVTTLIAGLGLSGIAVALAVQNILGDLFASFSIVFDKPFVIGDFIIVDDFMGAVEYVGLKTTRIRSLSGEQLIFSNGDLLKSRIRNYKRMNERRVVFSIGVLYQTSYDHLAEIPHMIRAIIESHPRVRFDRAHFKEFGAYSLNFEIVYWIHDPDYTVYMDIQQAINLSIYEQFKAKGIEFAYPTQTLFVANDRLPAANGPADPDPSSLHQSERS